MGETISDIKKVVPGDVGGLVLIQVFGEAIAGIHGGGVEGHVQVGVRGHTSGAVTDWKFLAQIP